MTRPSPVREWRRALLLLALCGAAASAAGATASPPVLERCAVTLRIDPRASAYAGEVVATLRLVEPANAVDVAAGEAHVTAARIGVGDAPPEPARVELRRGGGIRVHPAAPLPRGRIRLALSFDAAYADGVTSLVRVATAAAGTVVATRGAAGLRGALPLPSVRSDAPLELEVVVPSDARVAAGLPGEALPHAEADGRMRHRFASSGAIALERVDLAVGGFEIVRARSPTGRGPEAPAGVQWIVAPGDADYVRRGFDATPALLRALESYFAVPYPRGVPVGFALPELQRVSRDAGPYAAAESLALDVGAPPGPLASAYVGAAQALARQWLRAAAGRLPGDDAWLDDGIARWVGLETARAQRPDLVPEAFGCRGAVARPLVARDDCQVVDTLAALVGPDVLQRAVRAYVRGEGRAESLPRRIAAAAPEADVADVLRGYRASTAVPLLAVTRHADRVVRVRQIVARGAPRSAAPRGTVPVCMTFYSVIGTSRPCALVQRGRPLDLAYPQELPDVQTLVPNTGARGEYEVSLAPEYFGPLLTLSWKMLPAEALALVRSLLRDHATGTATLDDLLNATRTLAERADASAATALGAALVELRDSSGDPAARERIERALAAIFGPWLEAVGSPFAATTWGPAAPHDRTVAARLVGIAALGAREPALRAQLVAAILGEPGAPPVPADVRPVAWRVALEADAARAGVALERALRSADPVERAVARDALVAAGRTVRAGASSH